MDSTDLTQAKADALRRQIARHLCYLRKLKDRMDALSFPENDLVYVATRAVTPCPVDAEVICSKGQAEALRDRIHGWRSHAS